MIEKRKEVGVIDDNPFLFARIGTETNIRGCDCLRKYAEESKASNPELLRSTKLRKHVATLCQLLDLDNQELEQVARFMGHDIRVHCDYYRQTDKTFQVAKIGKLLFAMEHGAGSLKGKNLKTLDSVVFGMYIYIDNVLLYCFILLILISIFVFGICIYCILQLTHTALLVFVTYLRLFCDL